MATSNRILRQRQESDAQQLATLELLSRDLKAARKGLKEVKIKAAPKYVTGVTKSQGDEEYVSNIKAFGSKQLARAFGVNMGMSALQQDILNQLEAKYGSGEGVREFVDLATQVICHLLIQAATHATDGTVSKEALPFIKGYAMHLILSKPSIKDMLDKLNGIDPNTSYGTSASPNPGDAGIASDLIADKVFQYLRPINLTHVERIDAKFSPRLRARDLYLDYILNEQAQTAVVRHMVKHPIPDDVLAPAAISIPSSASTDATKRAALISIFERYPAKDVKSTYDYYFASVRENLDMSLGIQVGDVKAYIDAAIASLRDASSSLSAVAMPAQTRKIFADGFSHAASQLRKVNPKSNEADEDIAFIVAHLANLLGAYDDVGTSNAALKAETLKNSGLDGSGTYATRVQQAMTILQPKEASTSAVFADNDIPYLDARDEICPEDVKKFYQVGTARKVKNALSLVFLNLEQAHDALIRVGAIGTKAGRPTGIASGVLKPTQAFANLVGEQITAFQKSIVASKPAQVNEGLYLTAMLEVYEYLLGATVTLKNLTTDLTFSNVGTATYNSTWGIPESRLSQIASGDAPTFSSSGVEEAVINLVNRKGRDVPSRERRVTRDYALASASLLSDTIASLRAQAENTNIAIQTRSNPAMSTGQIALTGTGALVGTHVVSAGLNRLVNPASGSMTAHAVDYLPSLLTAGFGAYKVSQGDKDLGYSLAGGAVAHLIARMAITCCPSLRFSDNIFAKILQAPTSGIAHIIGDQSMAASALTPASVVDVENISAYVARLVNANDDKSLGHIACQLYSSGLRATKALYSDKGIGQGPTGDLVFEVVGPDAEFNAKECCLLACALIRLKCVLELFGLELVLANAEDDIGGVTLKTSGLEYYIIFKGEAVVDGKEVVLKEAARNKSCEKRIAACKENMAKILNVPVEDLKGFILEPGYNMDVYSGEDQVSYLQPAPHVTSQPGMVQLEDAISRARRLGPQELLQEGIEDLQDVAIIRATPNTARMIEQSGMGTSLGMSRTNPGQELVALEVEGANGLWPVAPERQQSVPQGALNYAKIGHAPDVTVSSAGLFNRGVFTPRYGR